MTRVTVLIHLLVVPVASLVSGRVTAPTIEDCHATNQKTRNGIKDWINVEDINKSIYGYGMSDDPIHFAPQLSKDVGPLPIQHDFISQLGARMQVKGQKVKYLEIGVSVLKGIHTQAHYFKDAQITALDIEDPNPKIEKLWANKRVLDSWTSTHCEGEQDMRRANNRTTDYVNRYDGPDGTGNTIFYVAGDAFNVFTYDHVFKNLGRQNLILSDGMHTEKAVLHEIKHLLSSGIIKSNTNEEFAMVWDDCIDDIKQAFYKQLIPIIREDFKGRSVCYGHFMIPGWMGANEGPHPTCIFTTMDLKGAHMGASDRWKPPQSFIDPFGVPVDLFGMTCD